MEWLDSLIVLGWFALDAIFIAVTLLIVSALWAFGEFFQALLGADHDDEKSSDRRSHT